MPKKNQTNPKPAGKGAMAAWVACGGVLVVLSFLFGTMVNDGGATGVAATAATPAPAPTSTSPNMPQLPPGAQPVSADQVPEHLRAAANRPPGTGTRAPVTASPSVIDLGTVPVNQVLEANAELRNTGSEPITIRSTRANCGCTAVDMAGTVIPPGRSVPLNATFNSQANTGPRTASITVLFEGYDEPLQVTISANVQS